MNLLLFRQYWPALLLMLLVTGLGLMNARLLLEGSGPDTGAATGMVEVTAGHG